MSCCEGDANQELEDLECGERAFDCARNAVTESNYSVVGVLREGLAEVMLGGFGRTYHHSVNTSVHERKHPDWRTHVAHSSPHTKHSSGMVVSL